MAAGDQPDCMAVSGGGTTLSTHEELRRATKLRRLGWLAWAGGLVVIIFGGALASLGYYKVGEMTGTAFGAAILIAIYLASNRKSQASAPPVARAMFDARGGIAFAAFCCAILVWNIYQTARDRAEIEKIAQRFDSFANQAESQAQQPAANAEAFRPAKPALASGSDTERMGALIDDLLQRVAMIQKTLQDAITAAEIDQVLTPTSIVTTSGRQRSRVALLSVGRALDNYEKQVQQHFDDIPNMPERYGISRATADGFREGSARTAPKARQLVARYIAIERQVLSKFEQMIAFVEAKSPTVEASSDVVLFQNDEDANKYNWLAGELSALTTEETAAIAEMAQVNRDAADKFKQLTD